MDNTLLVSERSKLVQCSDVECIDSFVFSNPSWELKQLFSKIPKTLTDQLDANGVKNNRILFLFMCYNYKKSNKPISYKEILGKIDNYHKNQEQISEQNTLERINRLTKVAETNFKKVNFGDTICLNFPIGYSNGVYEALYRIPFENEELCSLICTILKKEFEPKNKQYKFGKDQFFLTMKVVKWNPKPLHFAFEDIKQSDTLVLDIFDYGREIEVIK